MIVLILIFLVSCFRGKQDSKLSCWHVWFTSFRFHAIYNASNSIFFSIIVTKPSRKAGTTAGNVTNAHPVVNHLVTLTYVPTFRALGHESVPCVEPEGGW